MNVDVVVVGARCAGSPLATLLAKRGLRVIVLDRAHFPSEVPSTHIIQPSGVQLLERLGALDALWRAGAVPIEAFSLIVDDARIESEASTASFGAPALCARRIMLDAVLVEAAQAAGADVRTGQKVTGLVRENGRVAGVVCDGTEIRAPLVVGADGRHSTVATEVGAREYRIAPSERTFAWGYFEGVDTDVRLRLGRIGDDAFLSGQTDSGLFMAGAALAHDDAGGVLADPTRCDTPSGWRTPSKPGWRMTRSTVDSRTGGTGGTRTAGRCTGSPPTSAPRDRSRRSSARSCTTSRLTRQTR